MLDSYNAAQCLLYMSTHMLAPNAPTIQHFSSVPNHSLSSVLETRRIDPLTDPRPLRYLCSHKAVSLAISLKCPSSQAPKHTLSILAAILYRLVPSALLSSSSTKPSGNPLSSSLLHRPLISQDHQIGIYILRMDFRYVFSLRSNTVYLSFGTISASVGISSRHRTIGLDV